MNCTPLTAGSGAASLRRRGGYGDGQGDALPLISCSQAATLRLGGGYGNFGSGSWERGFANEIRAWERSIAIFWLTEKKDPLIYPPLDLILASCDSAIGGGGMAKNSF